MNSVFSAFKSNKSNTSSLSPTTNGASKKTLNLNDSNNYEKLRHIREKMSNLMIDDDEINLRKPPAIPIASMDVDDGCETIAKSNSGFDCVDSASPSMNGVGGNYTNGNLSSSSSSSSLNTISLASIKKHYNQDNSENYASENNLLSKCCNGAGTLGSATNVSIVDGNDVNNSASATNLGSLKSMPLSDANDASKSVSSIFNKQPQQNNNLSNTNRNRPRLSLSNACNGTNANQQPQPAVHGRNNGNGLPTGRTRLSTHQRNLSLDFRFKMFGTSNLFQVENVFQLSRGGISCLQPENISKILSLITLIFFKTNTIWVKVRWVNDIVAAVDILLILTTILTHGSGLSNQISAFN
ncbi:CLUMA_CG004108, isoform A [Clunio marinus]|uniref:CLUMA_CG004108, isoform A n=1 Tax=Clunio marinus TaxID=568069 RepID=A0A1J1HQT5_9DIPT|nr:CLUMA_CG004108, isoform A [Clunio marinus]